MCKECSFWTAGECRHPRMAFDLVPYTQAPKTVRTFFPETATYRDVPITLAQFNDMQRVGPAPLTAPDYGCAHESPR